MSKHWGYFDVHLYRVVRHALPVLAIDLQIYHSWVVISYNGCWFFFLRSIRNIIVGGKSKNSCRWYFTGRKKVLNLAVEGCQKVVQLPNPLKSASLGEIITWEITMIQEAQTWNIHVELPAVQRQKHANLLTKVWFFYYVKMKLKVFAPTISHLRPRCRLVHLSWKELKFHLVQDCIIEKNETKHICLPRVSNETMTLNINILYYTVRKI